MKFNRNRKQSGFSLIELLVVVAIMLVIAAIAVPSLLAAKRNANDSAAIQELRQIDNAQMAFTNAYQNGYAPTLAILGGVSTVCAPGGTGATATSACLLDNTFAASGIKSGYTFNMVATAGSATASPSFTAAASPNALGSSGNNSYCSGVDNVVRIVPAAQYTNPTAATCSAFAPINSSVTN